MREDQRRLGTQPAVPLAIELGSQVSRPAMFDVAFYGCNSKVVRDEDAALTTTLGDGRAKRAFRWLSSARLID